MTLNIIAVKYGTRYWVGFKQVVAGFWKTSVSYYSHIGTFHHTYKT